MTSAGCFDEASKSMSPMTSLDRRKLPAVLQRITSGCARRLSSNGSAAGKRVAQADVGGIGAAALDAFERFCFAFFRRNPSSSATLPAWQAASSFSMESTPSFSCRALIFLGPRPGISQHLDQTRREWKPSVPRNISDFPVVDQFGDFFLQRLADAFDFAQPIFGDESCRAARSSLRGSARRWRRRGS